MGHRRDDAGDATGRTTERMYRRALAAGLAGSLIVHLALLFAPPVESNLPGHLEAADGIVLLPPPDDVPPEVEVPPPPEEIDRPAEPAVEEGPVQPASAPRPEFVPHDVPPKLLNDEALQEYLELFYPTTLLAASVEGAVHVWLYVNRRGEATKMQIRSSSGSPQFDRLARSAAPFMRFRPALSQGDPIGVWVSLWLRFDIEEVDPDEDRPRLAGGVSD